MTLQSWLENRWIVQVPTSNEELRNLRAIVARELQDSQVDGISLDARLGMLYNAALKLAEMALRAHGYRVPAGGGRHHERTIASLVLTLGEGWRSTMNIINQVRVMRHRADYESVGIATSAEIRDLRAEVDRLLPVVEDLARSRGFSL
jgi:hypothetical protein